MDLRTWWTSWMDAGTARGTGWSRRLDGRGTWEAQCGLTQLCLDLPRKGGAHMPGLGHLPAISAVLLEPSPAPQIELRESKGAVSVTAHFRAKLLWISRSRHVNHQSPLPLHPSSPLRANRRFLEIYLNFH
ncbi:hypothetical protein DPEC_G00217430 [Dallia pectoralis]|uniref:Uncharacterized protein n=1 Tax=Dallia pectoralis TaxID=75939 RepID=A0ACC2G320_DALPE|nr:hypothetical protein DPEC_G00217430 [Dallia pectoralis]